MNRFLRVFALILCVVLPLCSCDLFSLSGEKIDEFAFDFETQLSPPQPGEEIAVVTTTEGVIKMKFFPQYAPQAVENFKQLAADGFYNDTYVFCVQPDMAFMAGSPAQDGSVYKSIFNDGKPFDVEYSDAIWHFSGSVSALSDQKNKADSRFFMLGNYKTDEDTLKKMERSGYPEALIEKYRTVGGAPALDRRYTVFAQAYEGLEVIDAINAAEIDAETGIPKKEIKIVSVEITKA